MKRIFFTTLIALTGLNASAASFDCEKASTAIEKTICADAQLSDLDARLSQSYKKTISDAANANADSVKAEQRAWITTVRNKCQDAMCLKDTYSARIAQLDGKSAPPTNVIPALIVSSTGVQDQPKAIDVAASAPLKSDIIEPPITQPVVVSAPTQKTEDNPKVAKPSPADPDASTSPKDPGIGLTDLFHALFSIGMLVLVAGMFKPTLAKRWVANPTRKKIFGLMLVYLIPVAALSSITMTPERKAYEASVRETERQEKRAQQGDSGSSNSARQRSEGRTVHYDNPQCQAFLDSAKSFAEQGDKDSAKNQMEIFRAMECRPSTNW